MRAGRGGWIDTHAGQRSDHAAAMDFELDLSLKEWAKDKPLSILQLDPADRAVLRIAGE